MTDDSEQIKFLVGVYFTEGLERAKELASLAQAETDDHRSITLSGMALVLALSNLASIVEHRLVYARMGASAEAGDSPNVLETQRDLRGGLKAFLQHLPTAEVGMGLTLAMRKPRAARLLDAVSLRNHLVHHDGAILSGSALDLGAVVRCDSAEVRVSLPENPWKSVKRMSGLDAVADALDYLDELDRFKSDGVVIAPNFFARTSNKAG